MVPYVSGNDSLLLDEPEELTSYAMVEDMAMIISFLLMIKWVGSAAPIVCQYHTHVFDWIGDPANTENREELS